MQVDDLDQAVELFGLVLQTRCQVFGGDHMHVERNCLLSQAMFNHKRSLLAETACHIADVDIRCASTYYRYGAALFYKAQDEQDVFGASLQAAAADTAEAAEAEDEESGSCKPLRCMYTCTTPPLCMPSHCTSYTILCCTCMVPSARTSNNST